MPARHVMRINFRVLLPCRPANTHKFGAHLLTRFGFRVTFSGIRVVRRQESQNSPQARKIARHSIPYLRITIGAATERRASAVTSVWMASVVL